MAKLLTYQVIKVMTSFYENDIMCSKFEEIDVRTVVKIQLVVATTLSEF